jgi:hypothetical protein
LGGAEGDRDSPTAWVHWLTSTWLALGLKIP